MKKIKGEVYFNRLIEHALTGGEYSEIDDDDNGAWSKKNSAVQALRSILCSCQSEQEYTDLLGYIFDYANEVTAASSGGMAVFIKYEFFVAMLNTIQKLRIPIKSYVVVYKQLHTKVNFEDIAGINNYLRLPVQYYAAIAKYTPGVFTERISVCNNNLPALTAVTSARNPELLQKYITTINNNSTFKVSVEDIDTVTSAESLRDMVHALAWLADNVPLSKLSSPNVCRNDLYNFPMEEHNIIKFKYLAAYIILEFLAVAIRREPGVRSAYSNSSVSSNVYTMGIPYVPAEIIRSGKADPTIARGRLYTEAIRTNINKKNWIPYADNERVYSMFMLVLHGIKSRGHLKPGKSFMDAVKHLAAQWIGEVCFNIIL